MIKQNPSHLSFVAGMREVKHGNYQAAAKQFQAVPFAKLSSANKRMILHTYVQVEQWQKALALDTNAAIELIVDRGESSAR